MGNYSLVHTGAQNCCALKYLAQSSIEILPGSCAYCYLASDMKVNCKFWLRNLCY